MAAELDIISDEDLQAPLKLKKNYDGLADTFVGVAVSMDILVKKFEEQETTITDLKKHTEVLEKEMHKLNAANIAAAKHVKEVEKEMKKMEEANKKAAKSAETMAVATDVLDNATGGLASQVKLLGKQMWALAANPVGAVLLAIGVAAASVASYFKNTAEGADKLDSILARLNGVAVFFTNILSDMGKEIVLLVEDIEELTNFPILDWILNKIVGPFKLATASLKIFRLSIKVFNGEITELEGIELDKAINDWGIAFKQMTLGVGDADEKVKALSDSLDVLQQAASKLERDIAGNMVTNAEARLKIEEKLTIVKDKHNHSDQERIGALKEIIDIRTAEMEKEKDFASRALKQFDVKMSEQKQLIESEEDKNSKLEWGLTLTEAQVLESKLENAEYTERQKLIAAVIDTETKWRSESKKNVAELGALEKEIDEDKKKRAEELIKLAEKEVAIRLAAYERMQKKATDGFAKETEEYLKNQEVTEGIRKNFVTRMLEGVKAKNDAIDKSEDERKKKGLKELQEEEELRNAIIQESAQAAYDIVNFFNEKRQQELAEESNLIEERRTKALAAAGDDERKKLAINRKFDREQAKIKTKQAQADKQAALFNILIQTAQNIAKFFHNPPMLALAIAVGATQAAFVAAKPLPKFEKGTAYAPSDFIAGEKGREIISHNGQAMLTSGRTLFSGMEGAKVFSNKETEEILGTVKDASGAVTYGSRVRRQLMTSNLVVERLSDSNKLLKRIANKPAVSIVLDENGFSSYVGRANSRYDKLRKRFYGK